MAEKYSATLAQMHAAQHTNQLFGVSRDRVRSMVDALGIAFIAWFAVYFATERLYADAAYFLMQVAAKGTFHVINGRWIILLIQWLPVLGTKFSLSISTLIMLFSLSNVVVLLVCYAFVVFRLKDRDAGTTLIAVQVVGLAHALFCPIFEFYFGAMLLVVFRSAWRTQLLGNRVRWLLLSVLFVLVISSHFMGMLLMGFMLIMDRVWRHKLSLWLAVLLAAFLTYRSLFISAYDADAFGTVIWRTRIIGWEWAFVPGRLLAKFVHTILHYPDTFVLGLFTLVFLLRTRDRWGLFMFALGSLVIYSATTLYLGDMTQTYYREIVDYPASVWVLFVLWARSQVNGRARNIFIGLFLFCTLYRIVYTASVSTAYVQREAFIEERISAARMQGIQRGLVPRGPTFLAPGQNVAPLPYMSPMESLLLSARQGPDSIVVLVPSEEAHPTHAFTTRLDSAMAGSGREFPTGRNFYFNMPASDFAALK